MSRLSLADAIGTVVKPLEPPPPALRRKYVKFGSDGIPSDIVTGNVPEASSQGEYLDAIRSSNGVELPAGYELQLVEAWCNTAAWTRDDPKQENAVTRQVWRYRFKPVRIGSIATRLRVADLDSYVKKRRFKPRAAPEKVETAVLVNLADMQIGKVDELGGTAELEDRFYAAMSEVFAYIKQAKPDVIVLAELGDGCENFQNTPVQAHTNDLNIVAQLDMHATFMTYAATELARLTGRLIVVGVPSNHMEVRENGKAIGGPDNDYGLLTMSQLKRAMALNPKAFGHVEFAWPSEYDVSVTLNIADMNVAFTHGHYARGAGAADGVPKWLQNQFSTFNPIRDARLVITGHFHHYRKQEIIGHRMWLQCPALDNGSAWLKRVNGQGDSSTGILVATIAHGELVDDRVLGNRLVAVAA